LYLPMRFIELRIRQVQGALQGSIGALERGNLHLERLHVRRDRRKP
jgi:hypothetical protein